MWVVVCMIWFSEPLRGTPMDRCLPPLCHPGIILFTFWTNPNSRILLRIFDTSQTNSTKKNFNSDKQGFKKHTHNQSAKTYFRCLRNLRSFKALGVFEIGSVELAKAHQVSYNFTQAHRASLLLTKYSVLTCMLSIIYSVANKFHGMLNSSLFCSTSILWTSPFSNLLRVPLC